MSAEPTSSHPVSASDAAPGTPALSARTQRHLEILERLAQQGADIATRLHEQVIVRVPPSPILAKLGAPYSSPIITHEIVAAFDLIARAVRRTILLAAHLAEPPTTAPKRSPAIPRAEAPQAARKPVIRELEHLRPEYQERLDPLDREHERSTRAIPDIVADLIARIARDLAVAAGDTANQSAGGTTRQTAGDPKLQTPKIPGQPAIPPRPPGRDPPS